MLFEYRTRSKSLHKNCGKCHFLWVVWHPCLRFGSFAAAKGTDSLRKHLHVHLRGLSDCMSNSALTGAIIFELDVLDSLHILLAHSGANAGMGTRQGTVKTFNAEKGLLAFETFAFMGPLPSLPGKDLASSPWRMEGPTSSCMSSSALAPCLSPATSSRTMLSPASTDQVRWLQKM